MGGEDEVADNIDVYNDTEWIEELSKSIPACQLFQGWEGEGIELY